MMRPKHVCLLSIHDIVSVFLLSWHLQKPCGTRPVCPSQAASGRTGGCWRPTVPRPSTAGRPSARAPASPWSPPSCRENQKPFKCLIPRTGKNNSHTRPRKQPEPNNRRTGFAHPTGRLQGATLHRLRRLQWIPLLRVTAVFSRRSAETRGGTV